MLFYLILSRYHIYHSLYVLKILYNWLWLRSKIVLRQCMHQPSSQTRTNEIYKSNNIYHNVSQKMTRSPEKIIGETFEEEDYSWKSCGALEYCSRRTNASQRIGWEPLVYMFKPMNICILLSVGMCVQMYRRMFVSAYVSVRLSVSMIVLCLWVYLYICLDSFLSVYTAHLKV